jgi:hypothetical protein
MLIVRDTFTAKAGQASKLAKVFKSVFGNVANSRVMTDLIGEYNTVVLELQVKNLSEYEELIEGYKTGKPAPGMSPDAFDQMKGYTDLYLTGRREIYQIVE